MLAPDCCVDLAPAELFPPAESDRLMMIRTR
jgi:hypothetical protein